jgi:hypothetical protein
MAAERATEHADVDGTRVRISTATGWSFPVSPVNDQSAESKYTGGFSDAVPLRGDKSPYLGMTREIAQETKKNCCAKLEKNLKLGKSANENPVM